MGSKLSREDKQAGTFFKKGNKAFKKRKYEEAIEFYDKAIKIKPNYEEAWDHKGIALNELRRYQEAIECYDKVLEINPKNAKAWYSKGAAYYNFPGFEEENLRAGKDCLKKAYLLAKEQGNDRIMKLAERELRVSGTKILKE